MTHLAEQGFDSVVVDRLLRIGLRSCGRGERVPAGATLAQRKAALEAWAAYLTCSNSGADVLPFPTKGGAEMA